PTMPSSARSSIELRPDLSSRELICSTERASEVPLHPLVDRRTRTNAQQGAWLPLQRAESRPRDFISTTSQEAYSATWSARKGMWLKRPCFGREPPVCAVSPCLLRRMLSSRLSAK